MASNGELIRQREIWRAELLSRRMAIAPDDRRTRSDAITRLLIDSFPLLQWMIVAFCWPYKGEFDPRFAIRHFRKRGARAALPVVVGKGEPLQFRQWWPGAPTTRGVFDLPMPKGTPAVIPQALLIPPVGFDLRGFRLGYGGGYFDRTLAALQPQPLKIGVAFELSRIETIHPQPHDVPMDFVVTERGVHRVTQAGLELIADAAEANELAASLFEHRCGETPTAEAAGPGNEGSARQSTGCVSPPCYAGEFESTSERESGPSPSTRDATPRER
jgi:5-formyltetrahydrofolate cyclo-ligase